MVVERIAHSGAYVLSEFVGNTLFTRTYYGCTRREAMSMFRAALKIERTRK